ncbi:MAG: RNase adapter RapZ [Desulfobacterales bacterium]|nr:RNase adapter RapZ [Desulfobacterales bacterium]
MKNFKILIITGLSGSGKGISVEALEDVGFYCVENMPVALLPKFLELPLESASKIKGFAFVMDLREKSFLAEYANILESLKKKGYNIDILFLEADEEVLLRRYSETRRQHPLSQSNNESNIRLLDVIRQEKIQLQGLRQIADKIINTSNFTVHQFKDFITKIALNIESNKKMRVYVLSFGYKYGIPHDADLIIDVRFLKNPYFISELKELTGETAPVKNYVLNNELTKEFLKKYIDLLEFLIPQYEKEGKSYLTIATGCTGGQHRSVVIASEIVNYFKNKGKIFELIHRDIAQYKIFDNSH